MKMVTKSVFDVEIWRCKTWNTDTFWGTREAAEKEAAFMTGHGFVTRVVERSVTVPEEESF